MEFLVITNRNPTGCNDHEAFGEQVNKNGPAEIRLAWAEHTPRGWKVDIVEESDDKTDPPSRGVFRKLRKKLCEQGLDCVFYIHGYNQNFKDSLQQANQIQKQYEAANGKDRGVAIVLFSWASNPGGWVLQEYQQAQAIALCSQVALDRAFEKMATYFREQPNEACPVSVNLLAHSLGNYLLKGFIESPIFSKETRMFHNILLHQADVDSKDHQDWVNRLRYSRRVYVTVNENDLILGLSDLINADRLGNTSRNFVADRAIYVDFSDAKNVGKDHQLFGKTADENSNVKDFFYRAFRGEAAHTGAGIRHDPNRNAYEVE